MASSAQRISLISIGAAQPPDTAFELGWDYAHHGSVPPVEQLHPSNPVRQGWQAGCGNFGTRTLASNRFVREWLQLRLNAWLRGRVFEPSLVNPSLLRRIDVAVCPITREALTHGTGGLSDASVDRVCNDAGYAAGNLAVMSVRANRAKSDHGVDDALAFVRQIEAGKLGHIDGLSAEQWARVAVLSAFATPLPHAKAALLPLLVLPPSRLRVLNPVQALQVVLSLQFTRAGHARRCAALAQLMPSPQARHDFNAFMHTLLARRLAAGRFAHAIAERQAVEDLWRDTLVNRRWQRLALQLTESDCERIGHEAAERALAGHALRWLPAAAATQGWALETRGRVTAAHASSTQPIRSGPAPCTAASVAAQTMPARRASHAPERPAAG